MPIWRRRRELVNLSGLRPRPFRVPTASTPVWPFNRRVSLGAGLIGESQKMLHISARRPNQKIGCPPHMMRFATHCHPFQGPACKGVGYSGRWKRVRAAGRRIGRYGLKFWRASLPCNAQEALTQSGWVLQLFQLRIISGLCQRMISFVPRIRAASAQPRI